MSEKKTLIEQLKEVASVIHDPHLGAGDQDLCGVNCIVMIIFAFISFVLTLQNIKVHSIGMAYATTFLLLACCFNAVIAGIYRNMRLVKVITVTIFIIILSLFAISAGNEGFALLWILLVPMASVSLVGVKPGVLISTYFLIFSFILFYSPLNTIVVNKYTAATMERFPILYLADYTLSLYLSLQKEYYLRVTQIKSCCDELTGLYNRSMFKLKMQEMSKDNLVAMVFDLNGLKHMNDTQGHDAGDEMIMSFATYCKEAFSPYGYVFRMGGDEFFVLANMASIEIRSGMKELNEKCEAWNYKNQKGLEFSAGIATYNEHPSLDIETLVKYADEEMYRDKAEYYQRNNRRKRDE